MHTKILAALISAAALLSAAPALAIQEFTPEPGWRYRVVGVAANDVLNVREQPGTEGRIIGRLQPRSRNTIVTGARVEAGGSVWWRVIAGDTTGWVNARYLTPVSTSADTETGYPLACSGTEPFWSLEVRGGRARLSTPGADGVKATVWQAKPFRAAAGNPATGAVRLESRGDVGYLAVMRTYDFCSDGMSDLQYPFDAVLAGPDGTVRSGCCERGG